MVESLPALQKFTAGQRLALNLQYDSAVTLFKEAVKIDTAAVKSLIIPSSQ